MSEVGRILTLLGGALVVVGLVVWGLGRTGFRGLPGDIVYQTHNTRIYIPIVTLLVVSLLLTLAMGLWQWLGTRSL